MQPFKLKTADKMNRGDQRNLTKWVRNMVSICTVCEVHFNFIPAYIGTL